jgi:hypothetical protein
LQRIVNSSHRLSIFLRSGIVSGFVRDDKASRDHFFTEKQLSKDNREHCVSYLQAGREKQTLKGHEIFHQMKKNETAPNLRRRNRDKFHQVVFDSCYVALIQMEVLSGGWFDHEPR